jgi:uncharacterized protein YjbI with pentapeptide repeats
VLLWAGGIATVVLVTDYYARRYYEWTGLEGKTLWDWADLLIVPVVIAVVGYFFTRSENRNAQAIAGERAQDTMLQSYLGEMRELLLDRGLRDAKDSESEVRRLARARTLTVLQALGPDRKRSLIRFLWEADLIRGEHPIISLYNADLSGANLSNMNLILTNFVGANLRGADLSGSALSVLRGSGDMLVRPEPLESLMEPQSMAFLRAANLSGAILRGTGLPGVDLWNANLSGADLTGARVSEEQLELCESLAGATMPDGSKHD